MKDELIDARFYELGRRIAEFDSIFTSIKKIEDSIKFLNDEIFKINNSAEIISNSVRGLSSKLFQSCEENKNESENTNSKLLKINESISEVNINYSLLLKSSHQKDEFISVIKKDLFSVVESNCTNKKEIISINSSFKSILDKFNIHEKNFIKIEDDLNVFKTLNGKIDYVDERLETHKLIYYTSIDFIKTSISTNREELSKTFRSFLDSEVNRLEQKISKIKVPSIDHLAEKSQVEGLIHQIQGASLDAKNAFIKSGNVDIQNQLNSKKLETIQLTLKQIELSKQV